MPKVSVIIPVYGVEKYIERCVRSLFAQTLNEIEFIFVNDATQDRSIEIIELILSEYPMRKSQTKIIHHSNNKGLPEARKTGISAATGKYVIHCDSDDWVDLDLYECLYNKAESDKLDVVICDFKYTDCYEETILKGGTEINVERCIDDMLHRKIWWSLCNKMFRKELYDKNILYPKDGMGEDMCLCLQLMKRVHSIGYVHKYYFYFINSNSIINNHSIERIQDKFDQYRRNISILKSVYSQEANTTLSNAFKYLEFFKYDILVPLTDNPTYYKKWKEGIKKYALDVLLDRNVLLREKIKVLLSLFYIYPFRRFVFFRKKK